jgi:GAF domain-containing protein
MPGGVGERLAGGVFTPNQLAMLELIASQAAISLEQARLYGELTLANEELQGEINERDAPKKLCAEVMPICPRHRS